MTEEVRSQQFTVDSRPMPALSTVDSRLSTSSDHDRALTDHITKTGRGFKLVAIGLSLVSAWGLTAWIYQLTNGLGVTGLYRPVYWGVYITSFVFFIGVSHAGTLISAILRLSKAEWRRSVTRMAEVITVMVIIFGAGNVIVDLGRPDRALYVLAHPNFRSPLLWDVCSISLYLTASTVYLLLPLLPDIVRLQHRYSGWRATFYRIVSFGYDDTPSQRAKLERVIGILAVIVIPIAISVHTVVSWVFAMTIQPMWHSSIFGPYFVVGAIFSGIAAILTFMVILRKLFRLENYIRAIHFDYLGRLLLVMCLLWFYFTFAEHLTVWYGNEPQEVKVLGTKVWGPYSSLFWVMVATCFVIPMVILCRKKTRSAGGVLVASIAVNIGMYLERFTIVVPTLINPRVHLTSATYTPSWVEWSILAACFSTFILLYMGFTKLFPIISTWEVEEGMRHGVRETSERIAGYLPPLNSEAEGDGH